MSRFLRAVAALAVLVTVAGATAMTLLTIEAYQYRRRTGEGFVLAWAMLGWGTVALLGVLAGVLIWLRVRDARRGQ